MPTRVDKTLAAKLLNSSVRYILSDIDGVVLSGPEVIPRVPEALTHLRRHGKAIRLLSNNASRSRRGILEHLQQRGIQGFTERDIYNSAYAAALRLRQLLGGPDGLIQGSLFVIGEPGLHEELRKVLAPGFVTYGLELHDPERVGGLDPAALRTAWTSPVLPPPCQPLCLPLSNPGPGMGREDTGKGKDDTGEVVQAGSSNERRISLAELDAVAVVVGLDNHFSSLKLAYAGMILCGPPPLPGKGKDAAGPRAWFIATNEDPQIPIGSENVLAPGAGCMVRAVETVSGRNPDAVCGKPSVDMASILFAEEGIVNARESCLMIGDRLITDIAFGNAAGCQTMLVLSGVEGMSDIEKAKKEKRNDLLPDYIGDSLACFIP
ncbi:unnamed protein product [Phytomonas sp. Hart1]|nr:unnamed protein product [Phytomonas sp. Hart1]|eukprot:CCW69618.1 unnamed protein product [Phytomonas sp. isolate Hart1]